MSINYKLYGINIPKLLILDEVISDSEFSLIHSLGCAILVNTIIIMCQVCVNLNLDTRQKQILESIANLGPSASD